MTQDRTKSPTVAPSGVSGVEVVAAGEICFSNPPENSGKVPTIQTTAAASKETIDALRTIKIEAEYLTAKSLRDEGFKWNDPVDPRPDSKIVAGARGQLTDMYNRAEKSGPMANCSVYDTPAVSMERTAFDRFLKTVSGMAP